MTSRASLVAARPNRAGHLEARPRRGSGRHGAVLAAFLQSDVQGDAGAACELRDAIAGARRGEPPQPEAIGNAFAIRITAEGAVLRNVVSGDGRPEQYSLDEFGAALDAWILAIERFRGEAP
jgi:hypothetical protein